MMPARLVIPPCGEDPITHPQHLPAVHQPLRVSVQGPYVLVQQLNEPGTIVEGTSALGSRPPSEPKVLAELLALLVFRQLYGREPDGSVQGDLVLESWGYCMRKGQTYETAQGDLQLAIIFDHLVPSSDTNPEVLQLNLVSPHDTTFIDKYLKISVDARQPMYANAVLAVPRCCQTRIGSTDRMRVNHEIKSWRRMQEDMGRT